MRARSATDPHLFFNSSLFLSYFFSLFLSFTCSFYFACNLLFQYGNSLSLLFFSLFSHCLDFIQFSRDVVSPHPKVLSMAEANNQPFKQHQRMATVSQLWQNGIHDKDELQNLTQYSERQIKRHIETLEESGSEKQKKYHRDSKLSNGILDVIETWLEEEPNLTLADMRDKLLSDHDINVSVWTISRRLKDHGIKLRSKTPVPKLTQNHKSIRVNWCQNYLNHNWSMTVFSDESYFYLERNKVKRWSRYAVRIPSNVKSSGIMVWGAISQNGCLAIKVDTGSLNAQNYINVLTTSLIPAANEAFGNGIWFFQQDNAPAHSAVVTQNFFAQNNIQLIQWPAKSPDLNIIEHIWAFMKNKVERREPKTLQELRDFIHNSWNEITPQFIINLYSSIPQRLQACIQRGGDTIDTSGVIN